MDNSIIPENQVVENNENPEAVTEVSVKQPSTRKTNRVQHNKTRTANLSEGSSNPTITKDLDALLKNTNPINYGSRAVRSLLKLYYIYLQNKYQSPCGLTSNEILINVDSTKMDLGYSSVDQLFDRHDLEKMVKCLSANMVDNTNEENLVFNVRLSLPVDGIPDYYNLLIFNTSNRKVYHIDPNGQYSPFYRLSLTNLFSSKNNTSLNNLVKEAIETIVNIVNQTLGLQEGENMFELDKNFNKMNIFEKISPNLNNKLSSVINTFNFSITPVIEDGDFNEVWLMLLTEFILKYKNYSPEDIYNNMLSYIYSNGGKMPAQLLRNLMLGYINYTFNRVIKMYNIIYNTKFTSADINTKISSKVYRIIGVIDSFSYSTVIENFKNKALLIVEYENYRKNNSSKSISEFISYITRRIDDFFPSVSEKMKERSILMAELKEEKKHESQFNEKVRDLKKKVNILKDQLEKKRRAKATSNSIDNTEHDLNNAEMELQILVGKAYSIYLTIYSIEQRIESISYYFHQREAFIESIHKFKEHNVKKAYRNASSPNKTMKNTPEPIQSFEE